MLQPLFIGHLNMCHPSFPIFLSNLCYMSDIDKPTTGDCHQMADLSITGIASWKAKTLEMSTRKGGRMGSAYVKFNRKSMCLIFFDLTAVTCLWKWVKLSSSVGFCKLKILEHGHFFRLLINSKAPLLRKMQWNLYYKTTSQGLKTWP